SDVCSSDLVIVPQQRKAVAIKACTHFWHLKGCGRIRSVVSLPVWPNNSSSLQTSSGCLTLNSNTGPVGRSLRKIAPWMPQRRYTFWAKLATPSFSVCKTTPRSSKYLPKQATAYAAAALQQGFVILWRRISFLTSCEKLNDLPPPRSGRKLSQRPL